MASRIKLSYHNRLFLLLLAFSWTMIACFVVFQYYREKQCKSEVLNAELQIYNQHLLKVVDEGADFVHYIETHEQPWEDQRITLIDFSGKVIYDNTLSPDSLDNHLGPKLLMPSSMAPGKTSAGTLPATGVSTSIPPPKASIASCVQPSLILPRYTNCLKPTGLSCGPSSSSAC